MKSERPLLRPAPSCEELDKVHHLTRRKFRWFVLLQAIPLVLFGTFILAPGWASAIIDWLNRMSPGSGNYLIAWAAGAVLATIVLWPAVRRWHMGGRGLGIKSLDELKKNVLSHDVSEVKRYREEVLGMKREFTVVDEEILGVFMKKYSRWKHSVDIRSSVYGDETSFK